ncbi:3449_t:CDS:2 [Funneliformis geosporum]|nr:3449_t:CDS:2 [Funneliformis geosporum]
MLLGYNLKWRKQQIELMKRTEQLEKKNGAEQRQINELKAEIEQLKKKQGSNPNQKKYYTKDLKKYPTKKYPDLDGTFAVDPQT